MKTTLKRVLSLLLALVLMLSLCACTQKSQEDSDEPDNAGGFALPTKNDGEAADKAHRNGRGEKLLDVAA